MTTQAIVEGDKVRCKRGSIDRDVGAGEVLASVIFTGDAWCALDAEGNVIGSAKTLGHAKELVKLVLLGHTNVNHQNNPLSEILRDALLKNGN